MPASEEVCQQLRSFFSDKIVDQSSSRSDSGIDGKCEMASANAIRNCRDLGGVGTKSGRHIRRGLLYRSAALEAGQPAQVRALRELGITLVVDLRSPQERALKTAQFSTPDVRVLQFGRHSAHGFHQNAIAALLKQRPGGSEVVASIFRRMPTEQAQSFAALYRVIADNTGPILFHCAAGKDRTGVAAALLLDMLGVSRANILADFRRSNVWKDQTREDFLANFDDQAAILKLETRWRSILVAEASYLEEMFNEVERHWGGSRCYMLKKLGLTERIIDLIENRLLQ